MHRIKTVSTYMCAFLNILLIALPIFTVIQWLLLDWASFKQLVLNGMFFNLIETPDGGVNVANIALTTLTKSIAIATSLIGNIPTWFGLLLLRSVFKNYQRGDIFVLPNAQAYQKLGWLCFLSAVVFEPLSHCGMVLVATLSNPPGHRCISLYFGTPNLESIFCGVVLIIISWIMIEAHALKSEQELTV